ncbi:MAG: hypothetical protein ACM336_05365 [Acidobacteriota bacterium]
MKRIVLTAALGALLTGCARRTAQAPAPPRHPSPDADYIDLRPAWRVRVITPLLKGGGYRLETTQKQTSGNTVELAAKNFEGYETAIYTVEPRPEEGVRVAFASAVATREGIDAPQPRPRAPLFRLPQSARHVRLLYLKRVSPADHDMAILAAPDRDALDRITAEVQAAPAACKSRGPRHCSWVPLGIAVRPESHTAGGWNPAR